MIVAAATPLDTDAVGDIIGAFRGRTAPIESESAPFPSHTESLGGS
jgi:hypothetical protein